MSKFKTISTRIANNSMPTSIVTRDTYKIAEPTENIYLSLNIISQRARQVSDSIKIELTDKLSDFTPSVDNLEEIHENREQIEISRFYERLPKPATIASEEFLNGKVFFRDRNALEENK